MPETRLRARCLGFRGLVCRFQGLGSKGFGILRALEYGGCAVWAFRAFCSYGDFAGVGVM